MARCSPSPPCMWIVDFHDVRRWTKPFVIYGVNPIVAFVGSGVMARCIYSIFKVHLRREADPAAGGDLPDVVRVVARRRSTRRSRSPSPSCCSGTASSYVAVPAGHHPQGVIAAARCDHRELPVGVHRRHHDRCRPPRAERALPASRDARHFSTVRAPGARAHRSVRVRRQLGAGATPRRRRAGCRAAGRAVKTKAPRASAPTQAGARAAPPRRSPSTAWTSPRGAAGAGERSRRHDRHRVQSGKFGVMVVSLTRGDTLFAQNAGEMMQPASTMKLFSTAVALDRFGPEHTLLHRRAARRRRRRRRHA